MTMLVVQHGVFDQKNNQDNEAQSLSIGLWFILTRTFLVIFVYAGCIHAVFMKSIPNIHHPLRERMFSDVWSGVEFY